MSSNQRGRKRFPTSGRYRIIGGAASTYYLTDADARRYHYAEPTEYATPASTIADCWLVDRGGEVNPGTINSPVPLCLAVIGRRVA